MAPLSAPDARAHAADRSAAHDCAAHDRAADHPDTTGA